VPHRPFDSRRIGLSASRVQFVGKPETDLLPFACTGASSTCQKKWAAELHTVPVKSKSSECRKTLSRGSPKRGPLCYRWKLRMTEKRRQTASADSG
jgi:hypothetical protein